MITDLGTIKIPGRFCYYQFREPIYQFGDNPVPKLNHYSGPKVPQKLLEFTDHWLKWQSVHVIALLSFPGTLHPNANATPKCCQNCSSFVRKELYHQICLSTHTHILSPLFHSFFCLMLLKDKFPTLGATHHDVTCWGADCSVFSHTFHISFALTQESRVPGNII